MENIKTKSEIDYVIWKILCYVWEKKEIAKTSQHLYERGFYNIMPNLPHKRAYEEWNLGTWCEEDESLCNMWKRFYGKGQSFSQNLQSELLEYIGQVKRRKKMGQSQRVNRIKALGNAIVPQVAFIVIATIVEIENSTNRT